MRIASGGYAGLKDLKSMPLVFAQNEVSLSEIDYADDLGKSYEYPSRYRKLIQTGERFVYYRGRRRAGSSQTSFCIGRKQRSLSRN